MPLIGYVVEIRVKGTAKKDEGWKRCNVAAQLLVCHFTVSSLDEKLEYDFKVSAQNQVGWGRHAYLREAASPKEILGETFVHLRYHTFLQIFFMDNCY